MVKYPQHHRIAFSLHIIRALLDFFLFLACPCRYHNLLPWLKQCAIVIHHTTVQLTNKRHVNKSNHFIVTIPQTQVYRWWKSFVQTAAWHYGWQILNATHIYKGLNTDREQHIVNILLYREHEMKPIINSTRTFAVQNGMNYCKQNVRVQNNSESESSQRKWYSAVHMRLCAVYGVNGMSSVQSDCLWKELVLQSAGEGSVITSAWR